MSSLEKIELEMFCSESNHLIPISLSLYHNILGVQSFDLPYSLAFRFSFVSERLHPSKQHVFIACCTNISIQGVKASIFKRNI